jgi:hypothetical protein
MANSEAIRLGNFIDVIGRDQTAGARHVVHGNRGIARYVLAQMARDHARICVIASSWSETYNDANVFAGIK